MLAAVLKELSKPLHLEEVETPSPGPDGGIGASYGVRD